MDQSTLSPATEPALAEIDDEIRAAELRLKNARSILKSVRAAITPTDNHIVSTGPVWAVIVPTEPVELPADLLADARRCHAKIQALNQQHGFKGFDFEGWLSEILRDAVYGDGNEHGAVQDWLDR